MINVKCFAVNELVTYKSVISLHKNAVLLHENNSVKSS